MWQKKKAEVSGGDTNCGDSCLCLRKVIYRAEKWKKITLNILNYALTEQRQDSKFRWLIICCFKVTNEKNKSEVQTAESPSTNVLFLLKYKIKIISLRTLLHEMVFTVTVPKS